MIEKIKWWFWWSSLGWENRYNILEIELTLENLTEEDEADIFLQDMVDCTTDSDEDDEEDACE